MRKSFALCAMLALLVPTQVLADAKVIEAKLGKRIVDRTIADETTTFSPGDKAFLWLKVEDAVGDALTVTWKINDQAYPATLTIGGTPWRTWSNKTLHIAGEWTVTVTDAAGAILSETRLTVK